MLKKLSMLLILSAFFATALAQEFRCGVTVNYQKLQNTTQQYESGDVKIFETMKRNIEDFINNRHWTNLEFEQVERIDCSINLILTQRASATDFTAQLSIQLRRPVYNSNYTTGLFNYMEGANDLVFSFNESQPLEFDPNSYFDNLSSTLAYYCYKAGGQAIARRRATGLWRTTPTRHTRRCTASTIIITALGSI